MDGREERLQRDRGCNRLAWDWGKRSKMAPCGDPVRLSQCTKVFRRKQPNTTTRSSIRCAVGNAPSVNANEILVPLASLTVEATAILGPVTDQEAVNRIAALAGARAAQLLRLRSVKHIYDSTPGLLNSTFVENGHKITLDKWKSSSQPYRDIERFMVEEKVMQYIVGPGLLPVVTALSKSDHGTENCWSHAKWPQGIVTRGVVGHLEGFGVRVMMFF